MENAIRMYEKSYYNFCYYFHFYSNFSTCRRIFSVCFLVAFLSLACFGDEPKKLLLTLENATWISAMSGRATSVPVATPYGFAVMSDNRFLFGCTEDGSPVLQRMAAMGKNSFLTALDNGFFTTVTNSSFINFINTSGMVMWSRDVEFNINEKTFQGRDGRLFVRGANNVACYGLNGTRKWKIETEILSEIPIREINDGSLLLFLAQKESGKTEVMRVSPFGEVLEKIVLNKNVVSAVACSDGVVLAFSDGQSNLLSVVRGKIVTRWNVSAISDSAATVHALSENRIAVICRSQNGSTARIVSTEDGAVINTLSFPNINARALVVIQDAVSNERETLVLADNRSICSVALDGKQVWSASLPERGKGAISWERLIYTKNNYLVFFTTEWAVIAFKTEENLIPTQTVSDTGGERGSYSEFYDNERKFIFLQFQINVDPDLTDGLVSEILSGGDYGKKEKSLNSYVMSALEVYRDSLTTSSHFPSPNQFTRDVSGTDFLLKLLPLFETSDAAKMISNILSREENVTHLRTVLKCVSDFSYDSDGSFVRVIEKVLLRTNSRDDATLCAISEALYNLCRFMGDDFLHSGARDLLSGMLSMQYSAAVRNYVRNSLSMLAEQFQSK